MARSKKSSTKAKAGKRASLKKNARKPHTTSITKNYSAKKAAAKPATGSTASSENVMANVKVVKVSGTLIPKQKINLNGPSHSTIFNTTTASSLEAEDKEEARPLQLMDLPVELRFMIYKELFVINGSILIEKRVGSPGRPLRSDMKTVPCVPSASRSYVLSRRVAFLATSKAIYAEASPYLYGANMFDFDNFCVMKNFLVMIGDRIQFLKHISISAMGDTFSLDQANFCFALLAHAKELKVVDVGDWYHQKAKTAFATMKPMLLALVKLHDPFAALNVIRITKSGHPTGVNCVCEEFFRTTMKKQLKLSLTPKGLGT